MYSSSSPSKTLFLFVTVARPGSIARSGASSGHQHGRLGQPIGKY